MEHSHPLKKILHLAIPMAGTQLITMASSFLCMTMLATLGQDVLAASALIFSTQIAITVSGMSILFSISFLIGHAFGAKHYSLIGSYVQQGWIIGIFISLGLMLIFWNIGTLLTWGKQPPHIVSLVQDFFYAHNWRVIPLMLGVCNQQLCYGVKKQKIDLVGNMLGIGVLLVTAKLLIFGTKSTPPLGVAGLGYAMAAQAWFYLLFTLMCMIFGKDFQRYKLFHFKISKGWNTLSRLIKIGWPISLQISGEVLSFLVNSMMIGWISVVALAAYQVVMQYFFLIIVPIFALSNATGILIGHAFGAQQFLEIKKIGQRALQVTWIITVFNALIFYLFPKSLASLYLDVNSQTNAETLRLIILLFIIIGISQIIDGLRNLYIGALRGLLDTKFPMLANLAVLWLIGIPLSYLLAFIFHWGVLGITLGAAIGMLIGVFLMRIRWLSKTQQFTL